MKLKADVTYQQLQKIGFEKANEVSMYKYVNQKGLVGILKDTKEIDCIIPPYYLQDKESMNNYISCIYDLVKEDIIIK